MTFIILRTSRARLQVHPREYLLSRGCLATAYHDTWPACSSRIK